MKKYNDESPSIADWTTKKLIRTAKEIDKAIWVTEDVSYGELFTYQGILEELNKREIISDEVMADINRGEQGSFDLYLSNSGYTDSNLI